MTMDKHNDTELIQFIYQNAEMGKHGLSQLIDKTDDVPFRQALESQLHEYQNIMDSSQQLLKQRGISPDSVGSTAKAMSSMMTTFKTLSDHSTSKMAEMLVEGNTMGIVKITKHLKEYPDASSEAIALANQLLHTEENNVHQTKSFL